MRFRGFQKVSGALHGVSGGFRWHFRIFYRIFGGVAEALQGCFGG